MPGSTLRGRLVDDGKRLQVLDVAAGLFFGEKIKGGGSEGGNRAGADAPAEAVGFPILGLPPERNGHFWSQLGPPNGGHLGGHLWTPFWAGFSS